MSCKFAISVQEGMWGWFACGHPDLHYRRHISGADDCARGGYIIENGECKRIPVCKFQQGGHTNQVKVCPASRKDVVGD